MWLPQLKFLIACTIVLSILYLLADGTLGFQFIYKNGSAVGQCNQTETIVLFQCDPTAQWDAYDPDVTRFLDGFLANIENECLVMRIPSSLSLSLSLSLSFFSLLSPLFSVFPPYSVSLLFFLPVLNDIELQWCLYCTKAYLSTALYT